MKLMIIILNDIYKIDELLISLGEKGITGGTVIHSTGMIRTLMSDHNDGSIQFISSIKTILNPPRDENRTILLGLKEHEVALAKAAINEVVGDLNEPGTGVMFVVDIEESLGVTK